MKFARCEMSEALRKTRAIKSESKERLALAFTAACGIAISSGIIGGLIYLLLALSSMILARPAFAQSVPVEAGMLLESGTEKEDVAGDLKGAMEIYEKVAADESSPRDLRSKALLRLAGCDEKLGRQAKQVYEQIIRDFADLPAAATARKRLVSIQQREHPAQAPTLSMRKVQTPGLGQIGAWDTDGEHATSLASDGRLYFSDLAGHNKHLIFKFENPSQSPTGWFVSRDFSMVALVLPSKPGSPATVAMVKIDGTGFRELVRDDPEGSILGGNKPFWIKWTWDGRYILLSSESLDGTALLLKISVADGQSRQILSLKSTRVESVNFSPDGRFIAYQVVPSSPMDPVSRIFVMPSQGGEPVLVYEERQPYGFSRYHQSLRLLDWTSDGRYLAISSERTRKGALHLLPVKDGRSDGAPIFVKYGDFEYGQSTPAGGLLCESIEPGGIWDVYLGSLDVHGRPSGWKPLDLRLGNATNPIPRWSSDSNRIVYRSQNADEGQSGDQTVHVRNLSTGEDREVYHPQGQVQCTWAAHDPRLFCLEWAERSGIISIAVDTDEVSRLYTFPTSQELFLVQASSDGQALYFIRGPDGQGDEMLRWEIATQQETILEKSLPGSLGLISPNEQWLFRRDDQNFAIREVPGGKWRTLATHRKGWHTGHFSGTSDGNWLFYHSLDPTGKHSLYRVSTAGGEPERLGDFPTESQGGTMDVSPDGSKIMITAGKFASGNELWLLNNFIPPAKK
jgi:Tol biopolymer transport system component